MSYFDYNLYSCPFCGADVKEDRSTWMSVAPQHKNYFSISCSCGAFGPQEDDREKAIMSWNTRNNFAQDLLWNPFQFRDDIDSGDLKGKLSSISFSCVLQILSSENKSGVLQLSHGQKLSAICLKDGQIIAASSNYGPQLGKLLFDKGLVTLKKLQEVLDRAKESGKHLGETLLTMGYIDEDTLKEVIHQQIRDTIKKLMFWKEGNFFFQDSLIEFDARSVENISIMGVMLDALRISDELVDPAAENIDSVQEII